jgi:hypothetical protein
VTRVRPALAALAVALVWADGGGRAAAETGAQAVTTAFTAGELRELADELGAADARTRLDALDALSELDDDALPAIEAHLGGVRRSSGLASSLAALRAAAPRSERSPVAALLAAARASLQRSPRERAAAEWAALAHALSAHRSAPAAELLVGKLLASDETLATTEGALLVEHLGPVAIPALVRGRTSSRLWLRALCADWLHRAGYDQPGRAVQQDDAQLLAAILSAYGDTLAFEAMPVVVSYLVDERAAVRRAAEQATQRFGRNAIWQLRERYLNVVGRDAPAEWGHQRLLGELQREHFAPRAKVQQAAIAAARAAHDPRAALDALEPALAHDVTDELASELGALLFAIGERALTDASPELARRAFTRSLRVSPDGLEAKRARARLTFLEAEALAARGFVDPGRYEAARDLDPQLEPAAAVLDDLSGRARERERLLQRIVAALAGLAMAGGAGFWLRSLRPSRATTPGSEPEPMGGEVEQGA